MTASAHEDEPAGTGPVPAGKPLSAFGKWKRDTILSAARQGVYPVDKDGLTVVPGWLAAMLEPSEESGEFPGDDSGAPWTDLRRGGPLRPGKR